MTALIIIGILLALVAATAYSYWVEPYTPTISRTGVEVLAPGSHLIGLRILHLSDFHLRRTTNRKLIDMFRSVAGQLTGEGIDLVCITGDLIETDAGLPLLVEVVDCLKLIGPRRGILVVLGNHDYNHYPLRTLFLEKYVVRQKNNTLAMIELLAEQGVEVLRNATRTIELNGERLVIVGIDDFISGRHSLQFCFEGITPGDTVVLLTHSPDVVSHLSDRKVDLVLAGHTHGGQMCLPVIGSFVSRSRLFKRLAYGLFKVGHTLVYITKGIGIVRYAPFRFRCAPEFAILELRPRRDEQPDVG